MIVEAVLSSNAHYENNLNVLAMLVVAREVKANVGRFISLMLEQIVFRVAREVKANAGQITSLVVGRIVNRDAA